MSHKLHSIFTEWFLRPVPHRHHCSSALTHCKVPRECCAQMAGPMANMVSHCVRYLLRLGCEKHKRPVIRVVDNPAEVLLEGIGRSFHNCSGLSQRLWDRRRCQTRRHCMSPRGLWKRRRRHFAAFAQYMPSPSKCSLLCFSCCRLSLAGGS